MTQFRESQRKIIEEYEGGMMGISAVPGSGKTFTLSHLAARLVEKLASSGTENQEVLIVTFSNSAVNSFKKRIADILQQERKLLPYVGYRVRTLHGLAHDIVRERPALVGLADDFQILDERVTNQILNDVVMAQLPNWEHLIDYYISPVLEERQIQRVKSYDFPQLLVDIAQRFIKHCKDKQYTPRFLQHKLETTKGDWLLAEFGIAVYADYQRTLAFRGAVDFDDLVSLALQALDTDPQYLARWQTTFPYVLEDEAQDSSELQERMLRLLTGERNWVRVGDPNQAINTTFTTASPRFLREFLDNPKVIKRELPVSGRSGKPIIDLANELVRWTVEDHPAPELRDAFYYQEIYPTTSDDPQQNPPAEDTRVHIHYEPGVKISPEQEIDLVVRSLSKWLPDNLDKTVAVLVPENSRGFKVAEALKEADIEYEELLRSSSGTRMTAAYLVAILAYLANPHDSGALARLFRDLWVSFFELPETFSEVYEFLRTSRLPEEIVWSEFDVAFEPDVVAVLQEFLSFVRFLLLATALPIDQLVLSMSGFLFDDPVDIALVYKISGLLRGFSRQNPEWRIGEFVDELRAIAGNERRFIGFEDVSEGYDPRAGLLTVSTMHASKGLEWDRVYLLACSNYGFPSLQEYDTYVSERWFVRDSLSLSDEALVVLGNLVSGDGYLEGSGSLVARELFCGERLRLLYVSLTRCREDLVVLWNFGRFPSRVENWVALSVLHLRGVSV